MERYSKLSILGILLPPYLVFYGIRQGAFVLLHGLFYTTTLRGLNVTVYDTQRIGIVFFDPLVFLDPASVFLKIGSYSNVIIASLDSTYILIFSNAGWFFFMSFWILIIGYLIHFYFLRTYSTVKTELVEELPKLNPYSQITLALTFFFVFLFQVISYLLLPIENEKIGALNPPFLLPIGIFVFLFALINVLGNLEDNYLYVTEALSHILFGITSIAIIFIILTSSSESLFFKMAYAMFVFILQYLLYKNILFLQKLKTENIQVSGSLLKQLFFPLQVNGDRKVPYFESSVLLIFILGFRIFTVMPTINDGITFMLIALGYVIAFVGVLVRYRYASLLGLGLLGYELLVNFIYRGVISRILPWDLIIIGSILSIIGLYACVQEYFSINNFLQKENDEAVNLENISKNGSVFNFFSNSWVKFIGFFIIFSTLDFLYTRGIQEALIFNITFIFILIIAISLINVNKYNFEGKLKSIFILILLMNFLFIVDFFYTIGLGTFSSTQNIIISGIFFLPIFLYIVIRMFVYKSSNKTNVIVN